MKDITHAYLVKRAARWLCNSNGCLWVLTERGGMEMPDAIGFKRYDGESILVECKTTLSDFYADKRKAWRMLPTIGMGRWRWYLTPPGLLDGRELPEGWGWLECCKNCLRKRVEAAPFPSNIIGERREIGLLIHNWANSIDYKEFELGDGI